jgi:tetratricopeptide (TPR) repeat protein
MELPTAFASSGSLEKLQQETIGATKERMMRELGDALGALASASPVVLLLEDLHWADPSSVDLLRHLSNRIGMQRLLIAGTFRPEDVERSGHPLKFLKTEMQVHNLCDEVTLSSWNRQHIAEYVDATFSPNDFPADLAALVHEKTEGHPLFVANLLQYLGERGDVAKADGHWALARPLSEMDLAAPESVRAMISRKIDALEPEERRALQYASVEGTEFLSSVTAKLLGVDEIDLEESLASIGKSHRLIETRGEEELPDGTLATRYRFSHALYQNYLYGDLVNKRRMMLHQQAGEQLLRHYGKRAPQIATQLAIHFEQGRDFPRAVEYLTHAGDHAAKLYGYAEAERHYTRALNLAQKLPEEAQPEHLSKLFHKRGTVNHAMGDFTQAAKDFANMLEQARVLDSLELQSTALNALTMSLFFSHRLDETVARATEALEVAERAGSAKLRVETMFLIGLKHCCYGELKEATGLLDEVVATSRQLNHKPGLLSGLTWRACLHFFQSEYEAAITMTKEALQLASELRDGFLMLCSMFFLGLSQGNQGKMSAALETLNEALKKAQRNGDLFWHPRFPNCIGWIYRELYDFESARKYNEEGIEVARRYHVMEAEANSLINRGIDHIRDGEHEQTAVTFNEVRDIFERDAWFRWRYNIRLEAAMAEHWLRQNDLEKAREFAERLMAAATKHEVHKYIAVAHNLMARVSMKAGDLEAAEKHFDAAVAELGDYPAPLVEWRVHAGRARLKSKMGDEAGAADASARASEIINLIAGNVKDEKLRNTFLSATAGKLKPNHG